MGAYQMSEPFVAPVGEGGEEHILMPKTSLKM